MFFVQSQSRKELKMTFAPAAYIRALEDEEDFRKTRYPGVPLARFNHQLSKFLPKLIDLLRSDDIRAHPIWGTVIPYDVPSYGTGESLGHCVRPDVLLTSSGPKICELDFVPSGRGYLLKSLMQRVDQLAVSRTFAEWYRKMGVQRIFYATASKTSCFDETVQFAKIVKEDTDLNILAGNIDTVDVSDLKNALVDRLSYRSEMDL